ncbi:unnamed protein product [Allacma fusca]|uniref:Uncharacterized protein n=1 Tax=Allacma fusca TaxID=39272 RepID=A0A8J2LPR8_9HEXA|nr:unnamed protein product [Allacma fusca]CAG7836620.1 unnamed protein product [Allacma fusca]
MDISIYTAVVLFCVTIAQADRCLFYVPVGDSVLKCGEEVYHADRTYMSAYNFCGSGRNGTEITDKDIRCIYESAMYIRNGQLDPYHIMKMINKVFPGHIPQFKLTIQSCGLESFKKSKQEEKFKHFDCLFKGYEDICGHKTCDWMNSFD